jgi:hypothetical protein
VSVLSWELVDCLESCDCQQSTGRPDGCPCSSSSQCAAACVAQAPANDPGGDPCASAWTAVCRSEPSSGCYCWLGSDADSVPEVRCADGGAPSATPSHCRTRGSLLVAERVEAARAPATQRGSARVHLVLLDAGEDPVELAARDLRAAVLAVAGHADGQRGSTVGTRVVDPARAGSR